MSALPCDDNSDTGGHGAWQRVSKARLCRICKGPKGCMVAPNGDVACLRRPSDEPATFGLGGWWHRTDAPSPVNLRHTPAPATPAPHTASMDTRDRVNRRLLELCPPSAADHAYVASLHERTDLSALYGTLPRAQDQRPLIATLVEEFGHDTLMTVPGFIVRDGHLRLNGAGLLITINDTDGHLVGFQVRYGPGDYRWLSTSNGPSTGAPSHIARPLALRDQRIYLVESPKTANILADRLDAVVIATAGHGNWKVARAALERLIAHEGAEVAVITLDADDPDAKATTVAQVEHSRQQLAALAHSLGYHAKIARWAHADGKGPDDLLINGHTFRSEVYTPPAPPVSAPAATTEQAVSDPTGTIRVQREALQRASAKIDTLMRAITLLLRLILTKHYTESEKKMLVWLLYEKLGYTFGLPVPEAFATVRVTEADKPRAGLSKNSFDAARMRFVADGVLITEKRPALEGSPTGRPFDVFTVNGERLEHLFVGLDTDPTDDAQTKERIARAAQRAEEARARNAALQEKKARREEQDKIVRQQLAHIGHERRQFAEVTERLSHQLTEKEAEAEAMRHAAAAAQQEAQRIIDQARQEQERIACRGCGALIAIKDWRCDDCRAEGTDADRFRAGEFSPTFGCKCHVEDVSTATCVPTTNPMHPKVGENPPVQSPGEDLRPCAGGCGALTPHGWTCKPCRERPPGPLHIPNSTMARREVSHGQ